MPTEREIFVKEQILEHEFITNNLNIVKCNVCLEGHSRKIKGGDNFWQRKTEDLKHWITHHVARGHGPPTFFVTLSCAENWWPNLK
jgi:hypothetical protein